VLGTQELPAEFLSKYFMGAFHIIFHILNWKKKSWVELSRFVSITLVSIKQELSWIPKEEMSLPE
jgi:hypothetical protein